MTYEMFSNYLADAAEIDNEERFINEIGFPPEMNYTPENYARVIHIIYTAARGTFKELVAGRNIAAFSRKFGIPYRTLTHWINSDRTAPVYITQLIAFAMVNDIETGREISKVDYNET